MITWHNVEQGSSEWHLLRAPLWTGSKAIKLLQGRPMPEDREWGGNDVTRRGHALEVASIREYERKYRTRVRRPGFITNSTYPNAGYSPDGIDHRYLLESKSFNGQRHDDLIAGKIPLEVQVQIYFGMIITGLRRARLLAYNPDVVDLPELFVIDIPYDKVVGNHIRELLKLDMKKRRLT